MEPDRLEQIIQANMLKSRIIWVALMTSLPMYLIVGFFLNQSGAVGVMAEGQAIVGYALMLMGLAAAAAGVLLSTGALPLIKLEGSTPEEVFKKLFTTSIISWSLCEWAGIFGLVIFILFGAQTNALVMLAVSAVGMAIAFPTKSRFLGALRKAGIDTSGVQYS